MIRYLIDLRLKASISQVKFSCLHAVMQKLYFSQIGCGDKPKIFSDSRPMLTVGMHKYLLNSLQISGLTVGQFYHLRNVQKLYCWGIERTSCVRPEERRSRPKTAHIQSGGFSDSVKSWSKVVAASRSPFCLSKITSLSPTRLKTRLLSKDLCRMGICQRTTGRDLLSTAT